MRSLFRKLSSSLTVKIVFNILCWLSACTSWLLVLGTVDSNPLYQVSVAKGNSMMPTINEGDLLISTPQQLKNLDLETIIVFQTLDGIFVMHRIVGFTVDGCYITKGDNNPHIDRWGWPNGTEDKVCQVKERYLARIPYMGKPALFIQNLRNPEV